MSIGNTKRRMQGPKTCKEHLLHNEKKRSVKNIAIVFDPRQLFDLSNNFMDPHHPRQNFDPGHPRQADSI